MVSWAHNYDSEFVFCLSRIKAVGGVLGLSKPIYVKHKRTRIGVAPAGREIQIHR
jgi:hypothetical protein